MSRKRKPGEAVCGKTHCCAASHQSEAEHTEHNSLHSDEISHKFALFRDEQSDTDIGLILTQISGLGITDNEAQVLSSINIYVYVTHHSKHSSNI